MRGCKEMNKASQAMINSTQIKKMHALKNALKMPDSAYRKLLFTEFYPATSSKNLTFEQAEEFINNLEAMAIDMGAWEKYEGREKYENLGFRQGMATPAQLRLIEALWNDVSVITESKSRQKALRSWLQKRFKVSDIRFLDSTATKKVIYALNHMKKQKPENGRRRVRKGKDGSGGGYLKKFKIKRF
jgi:hypothetical protein